jgi:hypothetical protein
MFIYITSRNEYCFVAAECVEMLAFPCSPASAASVETLLVAVFLYTHFHVAEWANSFISNGIG